MTQQGKKTRYLQTLVAVGIVVLVCSISVALMFSRQSRTSRRLTVKEVQRQIDGSIPIGSTRAAVELYLDSRSIPHSYVAASGQADERNIEVALIRGTSQSLLIRGDIQVHFHFDDSDRLTDYDVREIFTGP